MEKIGFNIVSFDSETTGGFGNPLIYDFGIAEYNNASDDVSCTNYLIKEVITDEGLMASAYYGSKLPRYIEKICNKMDNVEMRAFNQCLNHLLKKLGYLTGKTTTILIGYNLSFDLRAIEKSYLFANGEELPSQIKEFLHNKSYDLLTTIIDNGLILNREYYDFCINNNYLTDRGNVKTTFEVVHRFFADEPYYIEEHLAIDDARDELKLLLYLLKKYPELELSRPRHSASLGFIRELKNVIKHETIPLKE